MDAVRCIGRPLFILRERSSTLAAYRSLFTEELFVRGNWGGIPGYRAHVARCCRSFAVVSRRLRDGSLAKLYAQCMALGACFTADHSCPWYIGPRIVWFGRRYSTLVWRRLVGCRPRRAPLRDPRTRSECGHARGSRQSYWAVRTSTRTWTRPSRGHGRGLDMHGALASAPQENLGLCHSAECHSWKFDRRR